MLFLRILQLQLGAPLWMGTISVAWGAMATCLALMRGPRSFYALRFLLGVAEAGAFPGMFYVSKLFYTVPEIAVNNSYYGAFAAIAQVIGAVIEGRSSGSLRVNAVQLGSKQCIRVFRLCENYKGQDWSVWPSRPLLRTCLAVVGTGNHTYARKHLDHTSLLHTGLYC